MARIHSWMSADFPREDSGEKNGLEICGAGQLNSCPGPNNGLSMGSCQEGSVQSDLSFVFVECVGMHSNHTQYLPNWSESAELCHPLR